MIEGKWNLCADTGMQKIGKISSLQIFILIVIS